MSTISDRIEELAREWEEGANYGEAHPTVSASDYALSRDDWAAYLGEDGADEITALLALKTPYDRLCYVIDRVKMDDDSLDTDEYAAMALDALGVTL